MPLVERILPMVEPHRVVVLALPAVVAFDLSIPAQIFGNPVERERYLFTVCAEAVGPVQTTTGFTLHASRSLRALREADTVIVPGYGPTDAPSVAVCRALRAAVVRGARMASVCTGAFALAAAGILDGKRATTHWQHAAEFAERFPHVELTPDVLYVDEGQISTSAGVAAGIDLCLHLYRNDFGASAAAAVARRMVVAPHRSGGQAQFLERPLPPTGSSDGGVVDTCAWALGRLAEPLTVSSLARHAGYAPRTFARQFVRQTGTTPLRWLTAQRLLEARRLLEGTDLPIDDVARRSGFGTATNLRIHLARDASTTPTAYRTTFRG
jgi:transcriptional regulator GlxA family with amidase domain